MSFDDLRNKDDFIKKDNKKLIIGNELKECKNCNGAGFQETTTMDISHSIFVKKRIECPVCDGKGIRENDEIPYYYMSLEWCKCETKGEEVLFEDGLNPALYKHHYRCRDCGKITQIG